MQSIGIFVPEVGSVIVYEGIILENMNDLFLVLSRAFVLELWIISM